MPCEYQALRHENRKYTEMFRILGKYKSGRVNKIKLNFSF